MTYLFLHQCLFTGTRLSPPWTAKIAECCERFFIVGVDRTVPKPLTRACEVVFWKRTHIP